jgi:hypothetical protein
MSQFTKNWLLDPLLLELLLLLSSRHVWAWAALVTSHTASGNTRSAYAQVRQAFGQLFD